MRQAILTLQHIQKKFGTKEVLQDLNLTVEKGEILALVGPSGSGKTTILKLMNQLVRQTSGTILFNNQDIQTQDIRHVRWQMGYVLQEIALFPNMTVAENIAVIPEMMRWNKNEIKEKTWELLQEVGLDPDVYAPRFPHELSGGEQQRIGILRALIFAPEILLMDEPFSALDPLSRTALQDLVLDLYAKRKMTIVLVTHDMEEALKMGSRIAVIHEGVIQQLSKPSAIVLQPANDFVREFFKQTNQKVTLEEKIILSFIYQVALNPPVPGQPTLNVQQNLGQLIRAVEKAEVVNIEKEEECLGSVNRSLLLELLVAALGQHEVAH